MIFSLCFSNMKCIIRTYMGNVCTTHDLSLSCGKSVPIVISVDNVP